MKNIVLKNAKIIDPSQGIYSRGAIVIKDKIICFYVISSTKNQFHCKDMTMENLDEFIKANSNFNNSLKTDKKISMEI